MRLAYDELLSNQLALAIVRSRNKRKAGRANKGDGALRRRITSKLPYTLTKSQEQALAEIIADMAAPTRMLRLLQGDVGSGKTVVALLAMANAVEAGGQAALLAPTDILARQHFATLEPLCKAAGLEIALLTGRDKGKARDAILARLASGELKLIVGTHALMQEDVEFADLRLAIVDEQHRFGVEQRMALADKGAGVDLLVMTATPIPRTLMMTAYGDIDVSKLTEKPAGRQPIDTRTVPLERLDEVADGLKRAIAQGARIYWVCPLVDESESVDLAAATERHRMLRQMFGERVGLVHGKQKAAERDAAMNAFAAGDLDILVATTVIEVGVNVPEATVMVVEHAERFGLAQLHQLRGRVGRGAGEIKLCPALPGAARRDGEGAPADPARDRGWFPHCGGGSAPARRRRVARHAPERPAGVPLRGPRNPRRPARHGARRCAADRGARSAPEVGARRGAAHAALSLPS